MVGEYLHTNLLIYMNINLHMYKKGRRAEHYVVEKLWNLQFAAIRVPGSGRSYKRPHPDIVAGNGQRYIALEVKSTKKKYKYLTKQEISDLEEFCSIFGSEPWIAVKFGRTLKLYTPQDITPTEKGYRVDPDQGMDLEEFLHDNTADQSG
jgi:Holliday junction resolvase